MRILLDESLPRNFRRELTGHTIQTVPEAGWAHKKNGELVRLIEGAFEVFIIIDRGLVFQQNLGDIKFAIILLRARSNRLQDLKPLVPTVLQKLETIRPGNVITIG